MKKIITLGLATALFLGGSFKNVEAAKIFVGGFWHTAFVNSSSLNFLSNEAHDMRDWQVRPGDTLTDRNSTGFSIRNRIAVNLNIINSENLKARFTILTPNVGVWGQQEQVAGGGNYRIELRRAYIDWFIPNTDVKVRVGMQPGLKTGFMGTTSNPVYDQYAPGIRVDYPINSNISVHAQWQRMLDMSSTALSVTSLNAEHFAVHVPMTFDSFDITPWAAHLIRGSENGFLLDHTNQARFNGVGENTTWIGLSTKVNAFDPFTFYFDAVFSQAYSETKDNVLENPYNNYNGHGWLVDGAVTYKSKHGLSKLFAWYSPGQDEDGDNGFYGQIIPTWIAGSAFFTKDFYSSTGLLPNSGGNPNGNWSVGLSHMGFELMKNWHMGGQVMYIRGTHNTNNVQFDAASGNMLANGKSFYPDYLTTKDSLLELSLWSTYSIMKGLAAAVEINYILQDFDEDVWFTQAQQNAGAEFEDGFRASLSFMYRF